MQRKNLEKETRDEKFIFLKTSPVTSIIFSELRATDHTRFLKEIPEIESLEFPKHQENGSRHRKRGKKTCGNEVLQKPWQVSTRHSDYHVVNRKCYIGGV